MKETAPKTLYHPSRAEKASSFLHGLRMRLFPRRVLVAGPYAGEFGVEIFKFQSFVRWLAPRYETVHVLTYPGRDLLYRGPNVQVHAHDFDLKSAGYWYGRRSFEELNAYANSFGRDRGLASFDVFNTSHLWTGLHRRLLWNQKHVPLTPVVEHDEPARDIIFHFRAIDKDGPDNSRNFRCELAEELVRLCVARGWRCSCIGHPKWALAFEGCEDGRTEDLDRTVAAIRAAPLTVGELSGPIHLAVYADHPVVTWAPEPHRIAYARKHNPFGVGIHCVTDRTTHPDPRAVFICLEKILETGADNHRK
jgi:hypothetical protein